MASDRAIAQAFRELQAAAHHDGVPLLPAILADISRRAAELDATPPAGAGEAVRENVLSAIPTNWLDPLLTGPNAVIGTNPGRAGIVALLLAVRERVARELDRALTGGDKQGEANG